MVTTTAGFTIDRNEDGDGTTAIGIRRALAVMLEQVSPGVAKPGRFGDGHFYVSGTNGWAYTVTGGGLVIVRTETGGAYVVGMPSGVTVPTTPADGINPRYDVIYAVQPDPAVDGVDVDVDFRVDVAHGAAAATPVAPSIPAGAVVLARKIVSPGDTGTNAGSAITDRLAVTGLNVPSITWENVNGKPTTFPPSAHTHAWSAVTGKPSTFAPEAHTHPWSEVTGKPSTYPPSSHTHNASQIGTSGSNVQSDLDYLSGLIAGKANTSHTHGPGSIVGGGNFGGNAAYGFAGDVYVGGQGYFTAAFAAATGYTIAYIDGSGRLSKGASSERFKTRIELIDPVKLGAIFPDLYEYVMKDDTGGLVRVGWIAERLNEVPDLQRFVVYARVIDTDEDGNPVGAHLARDKNGDPIPESIDFISLFIAQITALHQRALAVEASLDNVLGRLAVLEG